MLKILHQMPGRIRFRVAGLRRSADLCGHLAMRLRGYEGITHAAANAATGNILIFFSARHTASSVGALIEEVLACPRGGSAGIAERQEGPAGDGAFTVYPGAGDFATADLESPTRWHTLAADEVLRHFGTSAATGLSGPASENRRLECGTNALPGIRTRSLPTIFKSQASSLPVALTGLAACIAALTGRIAHGMLALGVALVNAVIGALSERQAEMTLAAIRKDIVPRTRVLRGGEVKVIPFEELVVGDVLDLHIGARVPADARVFAADRLSVDEATLTGESIPVDKSVRALPHQGFPVSKRDNMVYRGTLVVEGSGRAVVVAVGKDTVLGRLQSFLGEVFPPEALVARSLKKLAVRLLRAGVIACVILGFVSLLRGHGLVAILRDTLFLLASSIPSGLSTLAMSAFALSHREMRRRRILVRRLRALGSLATIQVVCFDKTGTLTRNRMTATYMFAGMKRVRVGERGFFSAEGPVNPSADLDISWLTRLAALCNEATIVGAAGSASLEGSSTERALVVLAERAGSDLRRLRGDYPISVIQRRTEDRQFMFTVHRTQGRKRLMAVKGSPFEVLARCTHYVREGRPVPLGEEQRDAIEAENFRLSGAGLRIIGVAYRWGGPRNIGDDSADAWRLVWVGLVALSDPVRKGARPLIEALHRAGIRTTVITGDQSLTAQQVAKELGVSGDEPLRTLDASDLSALNADSLRSIVMGTHVFARLSPTQKYQVIQAYQSAGLGVAMVGDGFNDVLALKVADVGIAMGREGADLARRSADLVLEDDDLEAIVVALSNGSAFYDNLRRSVRYLNTTNRVDIALALTERSGLLPTGVSVLQSLWTNLVCLSLAIEPPRTDSITPRRHSRIGDLLDESEVKSPDADVLKIMALAAPAGAWGMARYGSLTGAVGLFAPAVSINQVLYANACRDAEWDWQAFRHESSFLSAVMPLASAWHILSTLFSGPFLSRLVDAAVMGAGALLSHAMLTSRPEELPVDVFKAPYQTTGEASEADLG